MVRKCSDNFSRLPFALHLTTSTVCENQVAALKAGIDRVEFFDRTIAALRRDAKGSKPIAALPFIFFGHWAIVLTGRHETHNHRTVH